MKSIAFYIENTNADSTNMEIYNVLNELMESGDVTDAALFFNNVDFMPVQPKFSIFNSHDLVSFKGTVFASSIENLMRANAYTSKYKLNFLYDGSQKDVHGLLRCRNMGFLAVTTNSENQKEYYRLTGVMPLLVDSPQRFLELLGD